MAKKPAPALRADDVTARSPLISAVGGPQPGAPDGPKSSAGVQIDSVAEMADGSAEVALSPGAEMEVEELGDGSAVVREPEAAPKRTAKGAKFRENLAPLIDPAERARIGRALLDAVERDLEDRRERDAKYAEGLKRTGLGDEAPGGADFPGASRVVHPMLTEGCVDFAARTMKEIFPAKGPVKAHIIGKSTREKIEKAERKRTYMNWQCTKQVRELRPAVEVMLTQLPLGGSQYVKVWPDPRYARPRAEFIPIDKLALPAAAADFFSAARKTHIQDITRDEFESRIQSKLYDHAAVVGTDSAVPPDKTEAQKANEKIEGVTDTSYNEDGLRQIYESYIMLSVAGDTLAPGEDRLAPYIASVDVSSGALLSLYRNWSEHKRPNDVTKYEELEWIAEAVFVPWRGAYGLGLLHIAGSLAGGATGALRALLDSALINNFPGALKLKGAQMSGQSKDVAPTEITEIEGPTGIDDIRKLAMPFPFNPPSAVLFELLQFMVESGRGVINTAEEKIADVGANAPVGTTLAVIEQGSITYSSIHARLHNFMERVLGILHRIDAETIDDRVTVEELGDLVVRREDFQGPMDVVPVSDPNIFSETQRYAQLQAVLQLKGLFPPGSFKEPALLEQAMRLLNYPNYEDVLNTPLEAEERTALDENVVASNPQSQLEVYELQDHLAHLQAHVRFMASPIFCANPLMAAPALPKLMEHCRKHLLAYYQENVEAAMTALKSHLPDFPEITNSDLLLAAATESVDKQMASELKDIIPVIQQLQQQMQQLVPPPPMPEVAVEQARGQVQQAIEKVRQEGETAREKERQAMEDARLQRAEAAEAAREKARADAEAAAEAQRRSEEATRHTEEMAVANRNAEMAEASERAKQEREANTALMKEMMETLRNNADNKTEILVAQIRELGARIQAQQDQADADAAARSANEPDGDEAAGDKELILSAMAEILKAQTAPRRYAISKDPTSGKLTLESLAADMAAASNSPA